MDDAVVENDDPLENEEISAVDLKEAIENELANEI
jgi:hypothetical protein